jgi:choline-sulfatase
LDEALTIPSHMTRTEFMRTCCPPLPDNFLPQQNEPEIIEEMLKSRPFRYEARMQYSSEQWRMHRWAYARLTERVDRQIGILLDALESSGQLENTVIMFTSDHGDMDSAHGMEHKTVFYEESTRIPLIVVSPNAPQAQVNTTQVVSNGLDLVPTILAYAGVTAPADLQGQSLKSLVDGNGSSFQRDYVPLENEIGSMVVTGRFKYALFDYGEHREQLYDLMADPGEMRNFAQDVAYSDILREHRELFTKQWPDKYHL